MQLNMAIMLFIYESVLKHGLRTTDCGLGIKYGLGIQRGLENTDWV